MRPLAQPFHAFLKHRQGLPRQSSTESVGNEVEQPSSWCMAKAYYLSELFVSATSSLSLCCVDGKQD